MCLLASFGRFLFGGGLSCADLLSGDAGANRAFCPAAELRQCPMGGAGKAASSALYARHHMGALGRGDIVGLNSLGEDGGIKAHGAGPKASPAIYARLGRKLKDALLGKKKNSRCGLCGPYFKRRDGKAHHRPAGKNLDGIGGSAAGKRHEIGILRPYGSQNVLRLSYHIARYGTRPSPPHLRLQLPSPRSPPRTLHQWAALEAPGRFARQ